MRYLLAWLLLVSLAAAEVTTVYEPITYACDGADKTFNFSFDIDMTDQIVVTVTDDSGTDTRLTETSEYSVTTTNNTFREGPGGTVTTTTAYPSGYTVTIGRVVAKTQERSAAALRREYNILNALDKLTMTVQELQQQIRQSLRTSIAGFAYDMNLPADWYGSDGYPYWDSDTQAWMFGNPVDSEIVATAYSESLIKAVSAGAAQLLLNIDPNWTAVMEGEDTATDAERRTWKGDVNLDHVYDVRDYGATGTGTTDDTTAIQDAFDAAYAAGGGTIFFPPGRYKASIVLDDEAAYSSDFTSPGMGRYKIKGSGIGATVWQAAGSGEYALTLSGSNGWSSLLAIEDLTFFGNNKDSSGIDSNDTTSPGVLGLDCYRVGFFQCDYGFKHTGALWYVFDHCTWERNNYGTYLSAGEVTNHGGCGRFVSCNWYIHEEAAVAIVGTAAVARVQQVVFESCINEANRGFAFFLHETNSWGHPIVIRDCYFELNGTDNTSPNTSVSLLGETWTTPGDLWCEDAGNIVIETSNPGVVTLARGTHLTVRDCDTTPDFIDVNDTAPGESGNRFSIIGGALDSAAASFPYLAPETTNRFNASGRAVATYTHLRDTIAWDKTNLINNGLCAEDFTPTTLNGHTATFTPSAAPIFPGYMLLDLTTEEGPTDGILDFWPGTISMTAEKIYYFSVDVKASVSGAQLSIMGTGTAGYIDVRGMDIPSDRWVRIKQLVRTESTGNLSYWRVYNPSVTDANFAVANAQLVPFDSWAAAYEYQLSANVAPDSTLDQGTFFAGITAKNGATSAGYIDLYEDSDNGSNRVRLIGPASTGDVNLTLPSSDGDASQVLTTDGSGVMTWTTPAGSGDMLIATYDTDADDFVDGNDTAYNATSWDGNINAPSMNAVRDKIETLGGGHDAVTFDPNLASLAYFSSGQVMEVNLATPADGVTALSTADAIYDWVTSLGYITAVGPGFASGAAFTDGVVSTGTNMFVWEGTTDDGNELILAAPSADPGADITITFPSATGTLLNSDGDGSSLTSVDAATGDSATAFFDAGALETNYGGTGTDLSATTGLMGLNAGTYVDVDTEAELETALGAIDILTATEGDAAYQPLEATLTDIADGTIAEDLVNTANPWADNEVADDITASNYLPLAGGTVSGEINSNTDITLGLDADNNGSNKLSILDGADAEIASIVEAGTFYLAGNIELGHATDTTIARSGAGAVTVEGTAVVLAGSASHDGFSDFVANEHIDWTGDQGATDIHSGNIPDLSATYEVQLTNEAGLYAVLSDVTQFYEAGDEDAIAALFSEGAYANSTVVSADIKDGEVAAGDMAATLDLSSKTVTLPSRTAGHDNHWRVNIQNPNGQYNNVTTLCLEKSLPAAITVTNIEVTCNAADIDVAIDLKWADAYIGLANAAVIDELDTTSGVASISAGFDDADVASGKCVYLEWQAEPSASCEEVFIDVTYDYD